MADSNSAVLVDKASRGPGRRPEIDRDHIIAAALRRLGPNRSVATLSLREVAREAGIAPNSIYRHFHNMDELAVALIDQAGRSLRTIIGAARQRVGEQGSVIRSSVEVFLAQLDADEGWLHILLREGSIGSAEFRAAVERELQFFEDELQRDLVRLAAAHGGAVHAPALTARAMTRLVFAMGARALDMDTAARQQLVEETVTMLRLIMVGTLAMGAEGGNQSN